MNKNSISKSSMLSYGVFVFSVSIVLLCSVSIIFPALIQSTTSEFSELPFYTPVVDPFELGGLAIPFVIINGIILLIAVIYYKKYYSLSRLFEFDISNKIAIIVIVIILSIYIAATIGEFSIEEPWYDLTFGEFSIEEPWQDAIEMEKRLEVSIKNDKLPIEEALNLGKYAMLDSHVKFVLLITSEKIFGDYRVIAFFASIALLIVTFFIVKEITKKRIPGIIAILVVLQSNIFLTYDTSAVYSNFWILFYVLSLYLILRKWQLTHISLVLSIFSKILSVAFLPFTIFFILNNTKGKKRIYVLVFYIVLIIGGLFFITSFPRQMFDLGGTYLPENFLKGFEILSYQLRFDPIILILLLPVTVMLFLKSLRGFYQTNSIQILISGFLLVPPILITFTEQTNEPYRLIALVVFFAIGVGVLFGKIKQDES